MKVQVYSKFRKNKIRKKVKSLMSMTNGRFNTSKSRGMLQKMGVLYTHSPQMPHPIPSPNFLKIPKKNQKNQKVPTLRQTVEMSSHGRRATTGCWPVLATQLEVGDC
jgi:hypothetical protein